MTKANVLRVFAMLPAITLPSVFTISSRHLSDDELLTSARLYARDLETGARGLTLAAALLLGTDDVIADVAPVYRTDALVQRENSNRYDDRITVRTNLIDSYDQLVDSTR